MGTVGLDLGTFHLDLSTLTILCVMVIKEVGGREEGPGQQHAGPAQLHALAGGAAVGSVGKLTFVAASPAP